MKSLIRNITKHGWAMYTNIPIELIGDISKKVSQKIELIGDISGIWSVKSRILLLC